MPRNASIDASYRESESAASFDVADKVDKVDKTDRSLQASSPRRFRKPSVSSRASPSEDPSRSSVASRSATAASSARRFVSNVPKTLRRTLRVAFVAPSPHAPSAVATASAAPYAARRTFADGDAAHARKPPGIASSVCVSASTTASELVSAARANPASARSAAARVRSDRSRRSSDEPDPSSQDSGLASLPGPASFSSTRRSTSPAYRVSTARRFSSVGKTRAKLSDAAAATAASSSCAAANHAGATRLRCAARPRPAPAQNAAFARAAKRRVSAWSSSASRANALCHCGSAAATVSGEHAR